jgi:hypothetical protein
MSNGIIELPSRYGDITKLIPLNHYIYKVDFTENPYSCRYIYAEDNKTIEAFDPSGGPYISIGYEIAPNIYVKSIYVDKKDLLISVEFKKSNY